MKNDISFKTSDLPIINDKVYHLDLRPEELARDIIIVGDPERVPFIADEFFDTKEVDRSHRGLRTITGRVKETGQRVSIITSGMGTPSLEIVLNEIVALNEIDFHAMKRKSEYDMITIIRVGTSGGIQQDTELGTLVITDYAVGLDNTGLFYDAPFYDEGCKTLEDRIRRTIDEVIPNNSRFKGKIFPYASRAHKDVIEALNREAQRLDIKHKRGITISNSGFFANQGRTISRVPLTVPEIDGVIASIDTGIEGLRIENMEMEASFLLHFMGALEYRAGVICPVIDNRREDKFASQYTQYVRDAAEIALRTLYALR
ncbi:MAG: nucleoside phosphorylase [Nitrospiraceae bacterium]|nr:nucleoside phosphorylase [Nitrospiraceae bacterium]